MRHRAGLLVIAVPFAFAATGAGADVTVSSDPTSNMTCSSGVCSPTATDAVLNVGDLETMLASGNVEVTTTGSGMQAQNIEVSEELSWWSASTLALDAYESIAVASNVSVEGLGGLTLTTNDGGSGGTLSFAAEGSATFANLSSSLAINGATYTLANSLPTLANAITANPKGNYALASSYDASGLTQFSPPHRLAGTVEGLGNTISNLTLTLRGEFIGGFVTEIEASGSVENIGLANVQVSVGKIKGGYSNVGGLAGNNYGSLFGDRVTGRVVASGDAFVGGLVGINFGTIAGSFSTAQVKTHRGVIGGLASQNGGAIAGSYASGSVTGGYQVFAGGLLGLNEGTISNSYATGSVGGKKGTRREIGGFIGSNINGANAALVSNSYSTGRVGKGEEVGGFIGYDGGNANGLTDCDWDTTTSGTKNGVGSGSYAGLTGLTTRQFQSELPAGFDPAIWAENPDINNGLPYLIANPPAKE